MKETLLKHSQRDIIDFLQKHGWKEDETRHDTYRWRDPEHRFALYCIRDAWELEKQRRNGSMRTSRRK